MSAPNLQDDSAVPESRESGGSLGADAGRESKTMPLRERRKPRPRQLDAGPFSADIASFRPHLAAEGKSPKTIKVYTEAVRYFAAAHLLTKTGKTRWEIPDIGGGILGSGLIATAGGLIFYGDGYGAFIAADATNGKLLWHFNTSQSWKGGPMTYTVDGSQYIGVAAGSTILAFGLR